MHVDNKLRYFVEPNIACIENFIKLEYFDRGIDPLYLFYGQSVPMDSICENHV